jgi:predicted ATP-grasp superfamily ATP-dependent carboligase
MKPQTLLIIGVRRPCYKAALRLGHHVVVWGDGPIHPSRKKRFVGAIEIPFAECRDGLTDGVIQELRKYHIDAVLGTTEASVMLASHVRRHLELKRVATDVVERFHNKLVMKHCAKASGIPITRYQEITENTTAEDLITALGLPLIMKPVDLSGAKDIQLAKTHEDIENALQVGWIAETFIEGRECSIESFVRNGEIIFQNITEYVDNYQCSTLPARVESTTKEQLYHLNRRIIEHFGIDRGLTHAEFYLTADGPLFGEIAMRPPGGYFMNLIEKSYRFDPWEAFVQVELDEIPPIQCIPQSCVGVYLVHPGEGIVSSIDGIKQIEEIPGVYDSRIKIAPGDMIYDRLSTGEDKGYIFIQAHNREKILQTFEEIGRALKITMHPFDADHDEHKTTTQ